MRLTGLLAILLFLLIVFFAAPAASHAQMASPQSAAKPDAARPLTAEASPVLEPARTSRGLRGPVELERDGVCYTMRTYVLAREERDSDVTRMVRYTTCLPAWKLQYKTAVQELRPHD
jgi:hypothetical protein